ncbi:MAG: histidine kinase [Flavobacterium sp. MedPE-SWcel]|uniref:2TM domain-containing protein n=1 Tax=uncultured Flavobacterium sp. TaxID=165435 RepID=UPI00091A2D93|nr:2TM domain-containing protein [uncultured Flavobacterium sp.]OIQ17263.1 MAG: histidine kinase [Flavobacterium sp. MedPE-SWcel]
MTKVLLKEVLKALGLGVIIFIVFSIIRIASGVSISWNYLLFTNFLHTMLYSLTLYMANAFVFMGMDKLFKGDRMSGKRLVVGFVSSFAVSIVLIFLLRIFEDIIIEGESFSVFIEGEKIENYYNSMIITAIITLLIHVFYFYKKYQENRVKQQKIIAGTASAKFETLKNQIDPHFLFNSLNVLSSLIEENPDNAQRFTTSLSKVYRYVLEQRDKELVSVEEELAFAKTYMNLLKMRFENSISFEMPQMTLDTETKVVPLSLQLLLENTIKHNIVSQQKPLHIKIFEEGDYLVVQNDFRKKEVLQGRKGVGLQNIISRYAIITKREVIVEQTEDYFTVKLPILTKQVTIMETPMFDEKESSYYKAQKRVEEIKGFYGHLTSYVIVNIGLAILNLLTSPSHIWFFYPAMGWGIGVLVHGMSVFNYLPFMGNDWEERKIRELMEKEKNNKWR